MTKSKSPTHSSGRPLPSPAKSPTTNKDKDKKMTKTKQQTLDDLKKEVETDVHVVPLDEMERRLGVSQTQGLSEADARQRQEKHGLNQLTPPKQTPAWVKFLMTLFGGFALLLWLGSILSFVAYGVTVAQLGDMAPKDNLYLGVVLAVVVTITGLFQYYQEAKSASIMNSFKEMVPQSTTVIRDGKQQKLEPKYVTLGDLVVVKGGDRIPADLRLTQCNQLKVDNSCLTGESEPQSRSTAESKPNSPILEAGNIAFFSTSAVEGSGVGIVVGIGDQTIMGRIATLASTVDSGETPIAKEIKHFIHIITAIAVFLGVTFFIIALLFDYSLIEAAVFLIGIIVANVPEGLLATVTVILTLTAKRMASKNCLVKNLEAVETLGSTSTICSDKTGTLTQNRMTVSHLWVNDQHVDADPGNADQMRHLREFRKKSSVVDAYLRAIGLCNRAEFEPDQEGKEPEDILKWKCIGDAGESAIVKWQQILTHDLQALRDVYPKVAECPFNSTNKYQVTVHENGDHASRDAFPYLVILKGAPEIVLSRCAKVLLHVHDGDVPIDENFRDSFRSAYELLGGLGERVLAVAHYLLPASQYPVGYAFDSDPPNYPLDGLTFLGLVSLNDPPRPAVPNAVLKCRQAGIKVVMVTGDHPLTARAIARNVNIISEDNKTRDELAKERGVDEADIPEELAEQTMSHDHDEALAAVVHGQTLKEWTGEQLDHLIAHTPEIVFARTSPQQKLLIVEAFQRQGQIVAVTGDGVNDSPALRKADIGIAMGIAGSDVSKQAADMILLDDNFASIVVGIEEGRLIFDNLKKSIAYTLTSNIPEISPFLIYVVLQIPLPLGVIAILCIDLGTDLIPAISLAWEQAESDIMRVPPRNPLDDRLVNDRLIYFAYLQIGVMQAAAGFFCYLFILGTNGFMPWQLPFLRVEWENDDINDLEDDWGQQWSRPARRSLEYTTYAGFFATIVIVQWADLLISKTRRNSLAQQGMFNHVMNFGLVFETALALVLNYVPGLNVVLKLPSLKLIYWFAALPWAVFLWMYDELRRTAVRFYPDGFIKQETYY